MGGMEANAAEAVDHAAHNARCDLELEELTFKITSLSDILKNQEKNTLREVDTNIKNIIDQAVQYDGRQNVPELVMGFKELQ